MKNFLCKLTAGVVAIAIVATGIIALPKQVVAENSSAIKDTVIYEPFSADDIAENYWTADEKTAPVKEGYVFGGWFEQVEVKTPETEIVINGDEVTYYNPLTTVEGAAYAKFVPAQVLSVKAQNEAKVDADYIASMKEKVTNGGKITEDEAFYVRLITSLDSANYEKIGFDIYLANRIKVYKNATEQTPTETNLMYRGIMVNGSAVSANDIFGGESEYLGVWQLSKIDYPDNAALIIYVRPYWITTDGTKVNGLAKYVHIEDDYLGYINVPINLLGGEAVSAGAVNMTYTNSSSTPLELVGFEKGRIFAEMYHTYTDKTVQMLGVTDKAVGSYDEAGETIYANLRFKKPSVTTEFHILDEDNQFCNWDEEYVDVKKVWDTKYASQTTN